MKSGAQQSHDVIVVGSGPGGAMVARDLARGGLRVLILEQGGAAPFTGTLGQMAAMAAVPGRGAFFNQDGSLLVRGVTAGGSSAINFATAMAPPLPYFARHGVDLGAALEALKLELPMAPLPDALIGPMARRIAVAARALGHDWRKLDKMIYPDKCRSGCWRCLYGCPFGAKWSARNMLDDAIEAGAELRAQARARRVVVRDGRAVGIEYSQGGASRLALGGIVVLAGGAIGSPRLLRASGLARAPARHFSDPVIAVMGSVAETDGGAEVPMAAGMHLDAEGIMLADMALPQAMYQALTLQVGRLDRLLAAHRTMTIMVKIRDELGGNIGMRWVNKSLQAADKDKLRHGVGLARDILRQAGARHVFKSWHFAAHPGGSVRIGEGVDSDLRTDTANLFVCDASVIPQAWGLPPTLTLLCLGKRLAAHLAQA
ncbi:GMC family oxidoreductase N-terminal domain-containing protein [Janthinobacterium sp.]|uniref:GMC family oxidoreductase N-terminal domain-containing protein n=1 Tax=Janthinobacterium sp. TaxID=1871054 RepID=UPI00293D8C67|nr:GMC family oxidoreductase N-terminal domain-containing protein [Janthinobacterium sp.]